MAPPSTAPDEPPIAPLHTYLLGDFPFFRPTGDNEQASNVSNCARGISFPLCAISSKTEWFSESKKILTNIEKKVNSAARTRLYNFDADDNDLDSDEKREERRGPIEHKHEADVVGFSRRFLLDPIERVLWYVCRLDFISGVEITLSGRPAAPLLRGRNDVTFTKSGSTKAFAVLEYKKRGLIFPKKIDLTFLVDVDKVDVVEQRKSLIRDNWDR